MAGVYLKANSRIYYAQWSIYDSETNRWVKRQRSTGLTNLADAEAVADDWQRNADAVAGTYGAKRRAGARTKVIPRLSDREREILEAAMANDPGRDPRQRVGLWSEFSADSLTKIESDATRTSYRLCCERWEQWCESQGRPLGLLDEAEVSLAEGWRDALLADGLRAKRVNFHLAAVSLVYQRAVRHGLLQVSPFAPVDRVKLSSSRDNLPATPFTEEELERLYLAPYKVAAMPSRTDLWVPGMAEEWEVMISLAAITGQRLIDAVLLRWDALDLDAGTLDYLPQKTGKTSRRISFPLRYWPAIVKRLQDWKGSRAGEGAQVFPGIHRAMAQSRNWPSKAFIRIMDAARIQREVAREGVGKGRDRHSHGFHSLRHTANTRCAAMGIPAEIRKELFGHSTVEMNRVYTHWDASVLDEVMGRRDSSANPHFSYKLMRTGWDLV